MRSKPIQECVSLAISHPNPNFAVADKCSHISSSGSMLSISGPEKHLLLPLLIGQNAATVLLLHRIAVQRAVLLKMGAAGLALAEPQTARREAAFLIHQAKQGPHHNFNLIASPCRTLPGWRCGHGLASRFLAAILQVAAERATVDLTRQQFHGEPAPVVTNGHCPMTAR